MTTSLVKIFGRLIFRHYKNFGHCDEAQLKSELTPTCTNYELDWHNIRENNSFTAPPRFFKYINEKKKTNSIKLFRGLRISSSISTRVHLVKKTKSFGAA